MCIYVCVCVRTFEERRGAVEREVREGGNLDTARTVSIT